MVAVSLPQKRQLYRQKLVWKAAVHRLSIACLSRIWTLLFVCREMTGSPLVCDTKMQCVCFGQFISNSSGVGCEPCPAGTYAIRPSAADQPSTTCAPCPRETFSVRAGQSHCERQPNCGPGSAVAESVQATAPRRCKTCQLNVSFTAEVGSGMGWVRVLEREKRNQQERSISSLRLSFLCWS